MQAGARGRGGGTGLGEHQGERRFLQERVCTHDGGTGRIETLHRDLVCLYCSNVESKTITRE